MPETHDWNVTAERAIWLILPAAIHLGGCIGDLAIAWVAMRQPVGTLVEDRKSGIRFYPPLSAMR